MRLIQAKLAGIIIALSVTNGAWATGKLRTILPASLKLAAQAGAYRASGAPQMAAPLEKVLGISHAIPIQISGSPEQQAAARRAISTWNSALGRQALVEDPQASLKLQFKQRLQVRDELGRTNYRYSLSGGDWQRVGEIFISTTLDGKNLKPSQIQAIILHELGHVLGLEDGGEGCMNEFDPRRPVLAPSSEEVATLVRFLNANRER